MWRLRVAEGNDKWLDSLNNHVGRQHWEFDSEAGTPEEQAEVETVREAFSKNRLTMRQSSDLLMRMQLVKEETSLELEARTKLEVNEKITKSAIKTTLRRAIIYTAKLQAHDGHWPCESAGPLYFLPLLVIAVHITGAIDKVLTPEHHKEMKRYIYNHQNEDGGWGLHIESHSTMFGSALNYIALRLLGEGPDDGKDNAMARGRQWILDHGGATAIPSWGKFWLTVLGVYEWDGCNPIPPELWLIPQFSPINAGNLFNHCRLVYMPMSFLYGKKFIGPITDIILSLRRELYIQPYHEIDWNKTRNMCAKEDLYYPHPLVQDLLWGFLHYFVEPILNRWPFSKLREKAMKTAMDLVHYEDINSRYFCIGAVIKAPSLLACWVEDPESEAYKKHLARIPDYLWVAEDGMKMQTFGSQLWDAAFATQAIIASGLTVEFGPTLKKVHDFIKSSQVKEDPSGNFKEMYRHICKGGWTFSTRDHGWIVSDCTGEGLKAVLLLSQMPTELVGEKLEVERLHDAVNLLLYLQSDNGGYPGWEPNKAFRWLEKFNPMEFFEDAMIEREYVECTSSVIQALVLFTQLYPGHRPKEIGRCIAKGIEYIEGAQNPDGSWYGCWGICYTYGTWFAVEALTAYGKNYENSSALRRACDFLLSKQLSDGGWGESYLSCSNKVYTNLEGDKSNLVQTSWALLALTKAGQWNVDSTPIDRGIRLLVNSQMEDGDFPQQEMIGVFMKNCSLNYSSFRNCFPIWALGAYSQVHKQTAV